MSDLVVVDAPPTIDTPAVDTPVVDTPPAVDTPLTCDAGATLCGDTCVDTATDASHCGACNRACAAGESCAMGTCACPTGQHPVGTVCAADDAPRPLAPVSLGDVTQRRPTLRWALPPGVDGAVVELCRGRACTMVLETLRVTGTGARPTADLPARSTVFWRMRGRVGTTERTGSSPTWIFHVPARSASTPVDTSFNPHFDINGDGFDERVVMAYLAGSRGRSFASTALTPDCLLGGWRLHPIWQFSRANLSPSSQARLSARPGSLWARRRHQGPSWRQSAGCGRTSIGPSSRGGPPGAGPALAGEQPGGLARAARHACGLRPSEARGGA